MKTYTVAIATRLKRKIFRAGNVPAFFEENVREALSENGMTLKSVKFLDYGAIMEIESKEPADETEVSKLIRYRTSSLIRNEFSELWSLPSLWTRRIYFKEGLCDPETESEIESFYASLPSR